MSANSNLTLISANAVSSTQTSADQVNSYARGIKVFLKVSQLGTGSLVLTIQAKDPTSGQYATLLVSLAVTDTNLHVYTVYPGITPTANVAVSDVVPKTWNVTVSGANNTSFTVGACLIV